MARNPHGSIAICAPAGRLRLQFPRAWYGGKQKYLTLGIPDTTDNRLYASNLVRRIEWDYLQGDFDRTYAKYLPQQPSAPKSITLTQLWAEYCQYKSKSLKPASMHYLVKGIGTHLARCPHQGLESSLAVREWLLANTTPGMTRRVLSSIGTALNWGIKHQKVSVASNPFMGMAEDIRVDKPLAEANAFSSVERACVIAAFEQSLRYRHYAPLVKFWFMTGCRPSEGIGLEWEQISPDCSRILFDRSIIKIGRQTIRNQLSKNNRKRTFPCQQELQKFLLDHRQQSNRRYKLVFPSPDGKPIDYINFSRRAWDNVVDPIIDRSTTPYSCRDTFITDQIGKGIAPAIIAKWVDNSVEMIERYYFDVSAIDHIKPL
jgi:integrase